MSKCGRGWNRRPRKRSIVGSVDTSAERYNGCDDDSCEIRQINKSGRNFRYSKQQIPFSPGLPCLPTSGTIWQMIQTSGGITANNNPPTFTSTGIWALNAVNVAGTLRGWNLAAV